MAANSQTSFWVVSLPLSTSTITVDYSPQQWILVLPSHRGGRLSRPRHCTKAAVTTETKQRKTNPKQFVLGLFQRFIHVKQNAETKQK